MQIYKPVLWLLGFAALLLTTPSLACDVVGYDSEEHLLTAALEHLSYASAAIDGVVTVSDDTRFGAITIIKLTRVWFGPRQSEYRIVRQTMCSRDLYLGQRARMLLYKQPPPRQSLLDWILSWFWTTAPTYTAGDESFAQALRFPRMREAVQRRALQISRSKDP